MVRDLPPCRDTFTLQLKESTEHTSPMITDVPKNTIFG